MSSYVAEDEGEAHKSFVVFSGRKPGVYTTWVDFYAQAANYKDAVVRLYDTKGEGESAWNYFKCSPSSSLISKNQIESAIGSTSGYVDNTVCNLEDHCGNVLKVGNEQTTHTILIRHKMQEWLRNTCRDLRIEEPLYTLHDHKDDINRKRHYRVHESMYCKSPCVSLGKFARTVEAARDNVSVLLLRRLLASHGLKIYDYNQHNVDLLECQLQKASHYNMELRMENATLQEEVEHLSQKLAKMEMAEVMIENVASQEQVEYLSQQLENVETY